MILTARYLRQIRQHHDHAHDLKNWVTRFT